MAVANSRPARGTPGKKGIRGRMPVKRSINLVLVNENRISPVKAILGILAILVLAALFSKYMVADRLIAMSQAQSRVAQLQHNLDDALELVNSFGEVEQTYAHYTIADMTAAELGLVDRTQVMNLVGTVLMEGQVSLDVEEFNGRVTDMTNLLLDAMRGRIKVNELADLVQAAKDALPLPEIVVSNWSVADNVLTVELAGVSLEKLNQKARELEESPIVDSCSITTANKEGRLETLDYVKGKYLVYLRQPPEEEVVAP